MNIFYEELPDCINVNGVPYKVITDFREWIRFYSAGQDDEHLL